MRYILLLNEDYDYLELDILEPSPQYYYHTVVSDSNEFYSTIKVLIFERETLRISNSSEFFHFYREVNINKRCLDSQVVLGINI